MNNWTREQIKNALFWKTRLGNAEIEAILDAVMLTLSARRLIVVPSYLSDEMYAAQKEHIPSLSYNDARNAYISLLSTCANCK